MQSTLLRGDYICLGETMIRMKLDVDTLRVIYFTNDLGETLHDVEHTLSYDYRYELPEGMSLDNCWNWTLVGDKLKNTETSKNTKPSSLFENNKIEVKKLLVKRVNSCREQLLSEYTAGDYVRHLKFESSSKENDFFIEALAKAKGISYEKYRNELIETKNRYDKLLKHTEINKEYYIKQIDEVTNNDDLLALRDVFQNTNLTNYQSL